MLTVTGCLYGPTYAPTSSGLRADRDMHTERTQAVVRGCVRLHRLAG
jgi:hypothetical protein